MIMGWAFKRVFGSIQHVKEAQKVEKYLKVILHRNIYKELHSLTLSPATFFIHTSLNHPALIRCPFDSFALGGAGYL